MELYSILQQYMLVSPPDFYTGDSLKRNRIEIVDIHFDNVSRLDEKIYEIIDSSESIIKNKCKKN